MSGSLLRRRSRPLPDPRSLRRISIALLLVRYCSCGCLVDHDQIDVRPRTGSQWSATDSRQFAFGGSNPGHVAALGQHHLTDPAPVRETLGRLRHAVEVQTRSGSATIAAGQMPRLLQPCRAGPVCEALTIANAS